MTQPPELLKFAAAPTKEDFLSLESKSEDQLYALLGMQVEGNIMPIHSYMATKSAAWIDSKSDLKISFSDTVESGKLFLQNRWKDLVSVAKPILCEKYKFCQNQKEILGDVEKFVEIMMTIASLLIATLSFGKEIAKTAATLLVKYLGKTICECS